MEGTEVAHHKPWEYDKLSWPEMRDAAAGGRVIMLPVGTTAQLGPHLPLDVDACVKCEWDMPESRQDARIEFLGRTGVTSPRRRRNESDCRSSVAFRAH